MIHAILLIPEDGDPHGLLREGPCGARPPMASRCDCGVWYGTLVVCCGRLRPNAREGWSALVLAWEGEPVTEGCDRADRAFTLAPRAHWSWTLRVLRGQVAGYVQRAKIVLLDEDGLEVPP